MKNRIMTALRIAVVAAAGLATSTMAEDRILLDGSTTVGPVAKAFAEYYKQEHPSVKITVQETGSGNGAKSLINDACDIACMSRFMKPKEFKLAVERDVYPVPHVVAMDGIAVIVHPSNPIDELTLGQVKAIYTGRIRNWKQLGGPDMKIVKISRDTSSGTYEVFSELALDEAPIKRAEYVQSNGAARARVKSTPAAIGYAGLAFLDGVKGIKINGVQPTLKTVGSGAFPLARPLFMWTNGYPKLGSHVHRYIMLHLSEEGKKIIRGIGFVPLGG